MNRFGYDRASIVVLWRRDVLADTQAKLPQWGCASSPLVIGDVVTVRAPAGDREYEIVDVEYR